DCLDITSIENIMGASRDPNELKDLWTGWHKVGVPMRQRYARFVALSNQGAREIGFKDTGAMWRSNYDMPPEAFSADLERLWQQVRPLYLSLHAYVRSKLVRKYGPQMVPPDGPIPAHLLGNPWAQEWDNNNKDDLRIKTCLQIRDVDFVTVHHELGHNFYQRAYKNQPFLFENGANDGFHEAIGDAIALAITPDYLHKVGLLEKVPEG